MYFDQKYNIHTKLINISASLTEEDKTKYFNIYMKYVDWTPPSYGYLQQIPGRDEVISLYVSQDNDIPDHTLRPDLSKGISLEHI